MGDEDLDGVAGGIGGEEPFEAEHLIESDAASGIPGPSVPLAGVDSDEEEGADLLGEGIDFIVEAIAGLPGGEVFFKEAFADTAGGVVIVIPRDGECWRRGVVVDTEELGSKGELLFDAEGGGVAGEDDAIGIAAVGVVDEVLENLGGELEAFAAGEIAAVQVAGDAFAEVVAGFPAGGGLEEVDIGEVNEAEHFFKQPGDRSY